MYNMMFINLILFVVGAFESIGSMVGSGGSLFPQEEAKKALIGLARDLRGLAFAFNTKTSYMMLFDWMYPYCLLFYVFMLSFFFFS